MLFNSYEFIFAFLPVSLAVFHLIGNRHRFACAWGVDTGSGWNLRCFDLGHFAAWRQRESLRHFSSSRDLFDCASGKPERVQNSSCPCYSFLALAAISEPESGRSGDHAAGPEQALN